MTNERDLSLVDLVIERLESLLTELKQKRTEQEAKRGDQP